MSDSDKTPSVKLPDARDISRTSFTPHGINRGKGSLKRPANKAELRKQRIKQTGVGLLVVAIIAGVAGGAWALTRPEQNFTVTGAFGKDPKISWPEVAPYTKGKTEKLITGSGDALKEGDTAFIHFETYQWTGAKEHEEKSSSYAEGAATTLPVGGEGSGFKRLDDAVKTAKVGDRYLLTIPVSELGDTAEQTDLKKTDNVVFVLDVVSKQYEITGTQAEQTDAALPKVTPNKDKIGDAPTVEIPKVDPPKELVVKTLIEGTGPVTKSGQTLVTNYAGKIWRDGKEFDSSWANGAPANFPIGVGQVISGWDQALVGAKVGSRLLLVIPSESGYPDGNESAGIKKGDTLVFVVDVLGAA
ncbi:FKBP-type peptidyl-prolyl cis-trans isomerase [Actinocorallia sp. A-T 12471]|uniref:FKBP-type peptidyl-prolyl cis-trans isomerase n=1 Tax=Actinocorallia sp. A-T 12471 TaxID=3089813 RepID=UPI0029CE6204|nr:FKBP-type peptidyl-prolyl cis-trans isomerase [Actinocorallia sp. A-T 12471]MDX6742857.1 FKBP-type peptidyl-prolyl cis-trans isomerase [Actinocorallia sp. A-T 12471]